MPATVIEEPMRLVQQLGGIAALKPELQRPALRRHTARATPSSSRLPRDNKERLKVASHRWPPAL